MENIALLSQRIKSEIGTITTLRKYIELLHDKGSFVIPDYQRGYVWGQQKKDEPKNSVSYLIGTLKDAYSQEKDVFLQGITVHGEDSNHRDSNPYDIYLVDGQQRTTFFYLLLKFLGYDKWLKIKYQIRNQSNEFLANVDLDSINRDEDENENFQDIFFFKRTLRIFKEELEGFDKQDKQYFLNFILDHVNFLFVIIPKEQAKIVFTMMNGNKAKMLQEELIKSELLRCSSKNTEHIKEAENISIRSRFAREWDKWLHWWNDEDVKKFFKCDRQLGWLLPLIIGDTEDVSFEQFKEKCLKTGNVKEAKEIFRKMRLLQKSIEDAYTNPITYNFIGAILRIRRDESDQYKFLKWYFDLVGEKKHEQVQDELKHYFNWIFIGMTHLEIIENNTEVYKKKRAKFLSLLEDDDLYHSGYETCALWFLRCNILEDCSQNQQKERKGRNFNFDIWDNRSLEHIYPKSKVGHTDENGIKCDYKNNPLTDEQKITLWRENIKYNDGETEYVASEHSIGNLVLLYKRENSIFNDDDFSDKKNIFFTINNDAGFQSRHLLHTISVFAHSTWEGEDIAKHKRQEIERFTNEYPEL